MTRTVYIGNHAAAAQRRSRRIWASVNIAVAVGICALSVPLLTTEQEQSPALAAALSLCLFAPMRAASGLMEWYLAGRYAYRSLLVAHLVGAVFGMLMWFSPQEALARNGEPSMDNGALGIFAYLLTTVAGLTVAAAVAAIRTARRGGPPSPPPQRQPIKAFSALFWFNTVFIVVVAVVIAPGMARQENGGLAYGFVGGLIVAILLRMPSIGAEGLLTKRGLHRFVYGAHLLAAALAVLVVLAPASDSAQPFDPVGGGVGIYLLLTSVLAWLALACAVPVQVWRRRSAAAAPWVAVPAEDHRMPATVAFRATATVPARAPDVAAPSPTTAVPLTGASVPSVPLGPGSAPASTVVRDADAPTSSDVRDVEDRTDRLRNDTGMAIGIVAGLASLVQGYDGEQIAQTVLAALVVGGGGLGAFYLFTKRR